MALSLRAPSGATIRDVEQEIETLLESLSTYTSAWPAEKASSLLLDLQRRLAPANLRASAQLEEDGRKKRSTAADSCWNFSSGEIVLFYESAEQALPKLSAVEPPTLAQAPAAREDAAMIAESASAETELRQCCEALSEAEKAGKQFIALKWFRDLALAGHSYHWAKSADGRQRVLTQAIDSGAILIKRIPNPRSPMHPTTTVTLNRESSAVKLPSRFNPIIIGGEPGSITLLRDRGDY